MLTRHGRQFMAWERSFEARVLKIREKELKYQKLNYTIEVRARPHPPLARFTTLTLTRPKTLWNAIWWVVFFFLVSRWAWG